jgi:precorrin-3B synthase
MTVRGWCPTLFEPMQAGDGWLLRIKPRRARLSAEDANAVAEVATRHGNGAIGMTNRGNLQVRGLSENALPEVAGMMVAAGLADADPGVERRRNLLVPPLLGLDPALSPALPGVIAALEAMLADRALADLPSKFGVVVDGGGALPLEHERGDVRVRVSGHDAWVGVDGSEHAVACESAKAADIAARVVRAFLAMRGDARRMRAVPAGRVFATAGLLPAPVFGTQWPAPAPVRTVGFPFGRLKAATLPALADLAGEIRVTPWRSIVLPGIGPGRDAEIRLLGGIVERDDPRRSLIACPGRPACPSATVATEADADILLASWRPTELVHLSGCAKGCAHPGAAAVTLVGEEGGRYSLIRNGRAKDRPVATGLTIEDAGRHLRRSAI